MKKLYSLVLMSFMALTLLGQPTPLQLDSLALVNLYNSTNGATWANKTNWLQPGMPVSSWHGIVVSSGRVTEINLPSNNLTGGLPDLSALTALTRLAIPSNLVQNAIPSTLNNLSALQHLDLRSNRFSGIIPSLASLTNLRYLSIGNNNVLTFQPLPAFILNLTQLEYLGLENNPLSGTTPAGFNNLVHLRELNLSVPSLFPSASFFTEVGSIQTLERLILVGMNLGNNSLAPFTSLPALQLLDIRNCSLTSIPVPNTWVSSSILTINASNNLLDFGDLESYGGVSSPILTNTGQNPLPLFSIASTAIKLLDGDQFKIISNYEGTQNIYQWYANGSAMPGQNGPIMDLGSIESSEAGAYRLGMTNSLYPGLALTSVTVTVSVVTGPQTRFALVRPSVIDQEVSSNSYGGYWADLDNDGDEDLFVNNAFDTNPNFLYRNNGDGSFSKETTGDIVTLPDRCRYVSWGDYDNDGFPDLYVGDYSGGDNISSLYRNNGNGTFSRTPFNHNSDGGLWADYDNDGDLDLSVHVTSALPNTTKLYKNNGNGTFDVVESWIPNTTTWVAGWVDMDNDLDADYFLADGVTAPTGIRVFKNEAGVFQTATLPLPSGTFQPRGASWADIDGDGDMDLFAENSNGNITATAESQFYINNGTGQFTMASASSRTGSRLSGARGSTFGDADNDGDLDLFVVHKYLSTSADIVLQLFLNNGAGFFTGVPTTEQFFGYSDFGSNLSLADYDNDGSLDVFIGNFDNLSPNRLYRNLQGANGNHWLKLKLVGVSSNRSAIGARIDVYAGSTRTNRQIQSSSGLSSQNSMLVHAGLGSATQADSIIIHWPSGVVKKLTNVVSDQLVTVLEITPPSYTVIPSDSLALVDFYTRLNGPIWRNKSNWLTGTVDTWFGVTVDTVNYRVTGLSLPNNRVTGSLPSSFTSLTGLTSLDLSLSSPFGVPSRIPADFKLLTSLTTLNLSSTSITSLAELDSMPQLTTLIVTYNLLSFAALEPFAEMPGISYIPQAQLGTPVTANIVSGNPYNVTFDVGGSANVYQWTKNGISIAANEATLSIPSTSLTDAGAYRLFVTNERVPGLILTSQPQTLSVVNPGPQNYFTWPQGDGLINDEASDSYGGFWADIDQDNDDDLAVVNLTGAFGRSVDLYENNGGTFTRLTNAGMPTEDSPRNISWADLDNDNDLDFYVGDIGFTAISDTKGAFYRNNGNKTFTKIALDQTADGGAWADYDNDGLIDLFIVDSGQPTKLYRNLGSGNFTLAPVSFALGSDWTLAFADIDSDRDLDFVQVGKAPNSGFNNLYRNDSIGHYSYQSSSPISTDNLVSARHGSWADIDNDGDMDFFAMSNALTGTVESVFYLNTGDGSFTKANASTLLGIDVRGRSSAFGDLDNDGDVDLIINNGKTGNAGTIIFLNNGTGVFSQIPSSTQSFIPISMPTFAHLSLSDANGDGFLDIFSATFNTAQPPAVYRNVGNANHWIKFRLQGTVSNRSGVGARVEIKTAAGRQIREVTTQTGLAAQNSLVQHFGIGSATQVDSVIVYWPSGIVQRLHNVSANQILAIEEAETPVQSNQIITATPIPLKTVGEAPFALNATATSGLPVQFSSSNPAVATINNNMVTVWGAGTTIISMNQPGDAAYLPATEVTRELVVRPSEEIRIRLIAPMNLGGSMNYGTLIAINPYGTNLELLHTFDSIQGHKPSGQLLALANGFLYGTTSRGGASDRGTIYRIKPDGTGFQVLHAFDVNQGADPYSGLIQASDGDLYGVTAASGQANFGTVFKIKPDGTGFTKLHDFDGTLGQNAYGNLIQATNGYLFGTTVGGGTTSLGTIYRIRTDGTGYQVIHNFEETGGASPFGGLFQAANGKLYGGTYGGGDNSLWSGTLFSIDLDGTNYSKLYDFGTGENGKNAFYGGALTQGRDGSLFGTTHFSGTIGGGTVFSLSNDSTVTNLKNFGGVNGSGPVGSVAVGPNEKLYGLTLYGGDNGLGVFFSMNQDGSNFSKVLDMSAETGYYPFVSSPTLVYELKQSQTIAFDTLGTQALGNPPIVLTASASSGLPVSYTSSNPSVAYIQSDTLFIVGGGTSVITARQPGNNQYLPADSVSQTLTVIDNVIRPSVPSSNLVFTNVFSTSMTISFTPGNGEKHLVAIRAGNPVTWIPQDGAHYLGNNYYVTSTDLGDGTRIVAADNSTSVTVAGLPPATLMHVRVFEYNDSIYTKYLTESSLGGSRATQALPNVYVTTPTDGATGIYVSTNVTARALTGATTYEIQLSPYPDFSTGVIQRSGSRTQNFTGLAYDSLYYSRVRTDLSPDFGPTKSFRTGPPEQFSYVTSPANNSTGVALNNLSRIITMNTVIGATTYTCELNTSPGFDGISQVRTGARTQTFTGLMPGTTYYSRVRTDLSANWGQTRQFTTASAATLTYVTSPANNATNISYQPSVTVSDVGASSYTVQLSPMNDFSSGVIEQTASTRTMSFVGLSYNTLYYSRARTNLDTLWGPSRSFTTNSPLTYSYMTSPANNAVNVNYVVSISSLTVPGATTYTIEANTLPDFTGLSIVRTGGRTLSFTLEPSRTYYVRVSTDLLPGQWGATRSFTTTSSVTYSYITSPANGATNVSYVTNITAYNVPLATSYTIEANTLPDFTGTSIVKMGTARTYSFTLAYDQVYFVRVQTNLAPGAWGQTRSFTTGNPQSLAFITSPANGVVGVPTTVNVTSNTVPGATSYTIELNTNDSFTGTSIVRTGSGRTKSFSGLSEATTYYARVSTNLTPGLWGPTRSFTTLNPLGRQTGDAWTASTDEDAVLSEEITAVTLFPNPFTDHFEVHVQTLEQQPLDARLIDLHGRTLFESSGWSTNRQHTVRGEFSPGVYLLDLRTAGTHKVVRVIRK